MPSDFKQPDRRKRGFERAASLVSARIRSVGETRGFSVSRLLTQWTEVVGEDIAGMAIPVRVSYAKTGFGATLTLLTSGSNAPLVQAQGPKIREAVNACYGYSAISAVKVTQTARFGFAEGQLDFDHAKGKNKSEKGPTPQNFEDSAVVAEDVKDDSLRQALENMGANILSRSRN